MSISTGQNSSNFGNFGRKISTTRKFFEFQYSLTRSVKGNYVVIFAPFIMTLFCLQYIAINLDYHHPYPDILKEIIKGFTVLADPFFWVTKYLEQYLLVVIIGSWLVLLYIAFALYCYVTSGLSGLRCKFFDGSFELFEFSGGNHGHNCLETPYLVIIFVSLFMILLLTIIVVIQSISLPDRLFSSYGLGASPTGRWHVHIILGIFVIYMSKIFYSSESSYVRMISPQISLLVNLLLLLSLFIYFPYFWKFTNFMTGVTFAISIGANISGIVAEIVEENDPQYLFNEIFQPVFLFGIIVVCVVLATACLCCRLLWFTWTLLLFKRGRKYRASRIFLYLHGVEQLSLFLPYCSTKELEKCLPDLTKIYGNSVRARVFHILRCFEKRSFDALRLKSIVRKLMQSQSVQERVAIDTSLFLYNIGERVVEMDFGGNSKALVVKQISRASKYESVVRRTLKKIFGSYLDEKINTKSLASLFGELGENDFACHKVYKRVLKKNSDNTMVLRRYGKYLLEIRLDPLKADSYLRQSMALERTSHQETMDGEYNSQIDGHEASMYSSTFTTGSSALQAPSLGSVTSSVGVRDGGGNNNNNQQERRNSRRSSDASAVHIGPSVSRISMGSSTSSSSSRFSNHLDVSKRDLDTISSHSGGNKFEELSVIDQETISNKKRLASRLSRENLISTCCLCGWLCILFFITFAVMTVVFILGYVVWGMAFEGQDEIFRLHDLSSCTINVGIAASQVGSSTTDELITKARTEMTAHCKEIDRLSNEVYSDATHQDLFRKKWKIFTVPNEMALIDALGVWRKHCELFLSNSDHHIINRNNDTSNIFLFENSEYMAQILRQTVEDYVDKVYTSVTALTIVIWSLQNIPFFIYPFIFPLIIYFCCLEKSLLKLLLIIPKNAIHDTYRRFGGKRSDNIEGKTFQSHGTFGTLTKLCCYMSLVYILVILIMLILSMTVEFASLQFFSYLKKESATSEYLEKMNVVYFYLNDFRNPNHPYFNKTYSSKRALEILDEIDEINELIRFGGEDFKGSDDSNELHRLYYDAKCETADTNSISVENIRCYSFNQRIDAHRQAVEVYLDETNPYVMRYFVWQLVELMHVDDTIFVDLITEIDDVQTEEFEEQTIPAFYFLLGFYISSLWIITFLYCCILCRYPAKVRRHLYRIRSAFLYLDDRHLFENKLYRVLLNPPSFLPWLSFSRLTNSYVKMQEKETRSLLEGLPVYATIVFDRFHRIQFLNDVANDMIGLPEKKIAYGLKITSFFVDPSKLKAWMKSGESNTFTGEMEMNTIQWQENLRRLKRMAEDDFDGSFEEGDEGSKSLVSSEVNDDDETEKLHKDKKFKKILMSSLEDENSVLHKSMTRFHSRVAVVRRKGKYLAVLKNIETEIHQKQLVEHEKKRSEDYLYNILPKKIAKSFFNSPERNIFQVHQEVSVVFQDMVGFTFYSSNTQPELIIAILNELFKGIDDLCLKNKMEKIKTIGDAYLAACGLPEYVHDHAKWSFKFARECIQFLFQFNFQKQKDFKLRSGIHSGKVVAGVIGKYKYQYDIWGDAVNTSARMEQTGIPDKIQVSRETYAYLYQDYAFEEREVYVKGKGNLKVYVHEVENTFVEQIEELQRDDLLFEEEEEGESDDDDDNNDDDDDDERSNASSSNTNQEEEEESDDEEVKEKQQIQEEVIDDSEMKKRENELRKKSTPPKKEKEEREEDDDDEQKKKKEKEIQDQQTRFKEEVSRNDDNTIMKQQQQLENSISTPRKQQQQYVTDILGDVATIEEEKEVFNPNSPTTSISSSGPNSLSRKKKKKKKVSSLKKISRRSKPQSLSNSNSIRMMREEIMREMENRMNVQMEYERQQRENWLAEEKSKLEQERGNLELEKQRFKKLEEEKDRASQLVKKSRRNDFEVSLTSVTPTDSLRSMKRTFEELQVDGFDVNDDDK